MMLSLNSLNGITLNNMKENKEETKLQSEQKTLQECKNQIAKKFGSLEIEYLPTESLRWDAIHEAAELYASQFKSQLPINQNMLNLIKEADAWLSFNTSPSAEQTMQFRQSLQEVIAAESQPLPIEGETQGQKSLRLLDEHLSTASKEELQADVDTVNEIYPDIPHAHHNAPIIATFKQAPIEEVEREPFKGFWKRLEMFVQEVQVNDPMSEGEKEMILRIARKNL